jgi:hypothetical protein
MKIGLKKLQIRWCTASEGGKAGRSVLQLPRNNAPKRATIQKIQIECKSARLQDDALVCILRVSAL